eukprot:2471022-Rhodomonas_salina.2
MPLPAQTGPRSLRECSLIAEVKSATCLCASYAMHGTGIACGAIGVRARYAMSGTEVALGAARAHSSRVRGQRDRSQRRNGTV